VRAGDLLPAHPGWDGEPAGTDRASQLHEIARHAGRQFRRLRGPNGCKEFRGRQLNRLLAQRTGDLLSGQRLIDLNETGTERALERYDQHQSQESNEVNPRDKLSS
jgi:hypothetical protein